MLGLTTTTFVFDRSEIRKGNRTSETVKLSSRKHEGSCDDDSGSRTRREPPLITEERSGTGTDEIVVAPSEESDGWRKSAARYDFPPGTIRRRHDVRSNRGAYLDLEDDGAERR
ncbi:hypothetical protein GWI33_018258 [Rhynchophorus ferrugineus]|uniref:Uncharacterized protein n=1 Tax=Rhynchophorus ferrugineus TaxID=354439 RepID=A0A834HU47_RHYFE|nr:hypothetical protein GWI33_018258 [Rhynchophorus ferrugineus]